MAGRYLITGVQVGMLMTMTGEAKEELLHEIEDKQFVGNSTQSIDRDCKKVEGMFITKM